MAQKKWEVSGSGYLIFLLILVPLFIYLFLDEKPTKFQYSLETTEIEQGKKQFDRHCASCHALASDGIGPALGGITTLIDHGNLVDFITNPEEARDRRTLRLRKIYQSEMPPFDHLDAQEIYYILSFIDQESRALGISPIENLDDEEKSSQERLAPPVKEAGLMIELEEFVQIPRSPNRPPDKGIATLRAHPAADGRLLVSDQMGIIFQVSSEGTDTFLDLAAGMKSFIYEPGIGTGLGSFVCHPEYLNNGLIYTTHAESYDSIPAINEGDFPDTIGVGLQWVLTEWKNIRPGNRGMFEGTNREVLRINTPTTAHGMQDIGFAPTSDKKDPDYAKLYLCIGDGGSNNIKRPDLCHDPRSLLGTILRIDPRGIDTSLHKSYGIPEDNPFVKHDDSRIREEIWALGFRNPHRLSWNRNLLIVADIGEANVEEINLVTRGGDYGWSIREGYYGISTKTDLKKVFELSSSDRKKYLEPYAQYDHVDGKAISGGYVYEGDIRLLQHRYFFGDIVTGNLFYLEMDEALKDSSIYRIGISMDGKATSLPELCGMKRVHLRIGYDPCQKNLFLMTKGDGKIWRIKSAYKSGQVY